MMTGVYVLILIGSILALFFPIAALLGFYDDRRNGYYRFRSSRFLIAACILVLLPIGTMYALIRAAGDMAAEAVPIAEKSVIETRALQNHIQDNISAIFPDILNSTTEPCYVAGISSYVQDQWAQIYRRKTCAMGQELCANDEQEFFDKDRDQRNPSHFPLVDFDVMNDMLGTIWLTASDMYKTARLFEGILDPAGIGNANVETNAQNYQTYRQYLTNCTSYKPTPWITPNAPLITSSASLCWGDCP